MALALSNVSATQELARQLREGRAQLRRQTTRAEATLSSLEQRVRALEAGRPAGEG